MGQKGPRPHGGQDGLPKALVALLALQRGQGSPVGVHGLPIGPLEVVHQTQLEVRLDGREVIPAGGSQSEGTLAGRNGLVILANADEVLCQTDGDPSQPARIVQGFCQRFGDAHVVQDALKLPEAKACTVQGKPQIDGLLTQRALFRQMLKGRQSLFVTAHGCARRRALHGLCPSLPAVHQGLVPQLSTDGMVGEAFDLIHQAVTSERFQGLDDARMQRPPPLLEQTAVRHLVGQGVLEGVGVLREEAGLVQELGRLKGCEATVKGLLGQFGNGLQQAQGHLHTKDGGRLQ
jgi:hypothetical protein